MDQKQGAAAWVKGHKPQAAAVAVAFVAAAGLGIAGASGAFAPSSAPTGSAPATVTL